MNDLSKHFHDGLVPNNVMPPFNYSDPKSVALKDYSNWFEQYASMVPGNLTDCDLEKEMQKVNITLLRLVSVCLRR